MTTVSYPYRQYLNSALEKHEDIAEEFSWNDFIDDKTLNQETDQQYSNGN